MVYMLSISWMPCGLNLGPMHTIPELCTTHNIVIYNPCDMIWGGDISYG